MRGKLSGLIIFTCLLAFVVIALLLRIIPAYSQVFTGGWVKFSTPDAYYFMRLVDHLVYNFPHPMGADPYFWLAGLRGSSQNGFFELLLSTVALLVGAGSPSPELVDLVGTYFPVVLGALSVIPGYFLGKALFNRWGGLLTAGLLAVMPGEYLARTGLGAADRDCLQVFLVVITMLFTALAVKCGVDNELFAKNCDKAGRQAMVQASIYSLLAGISLGLFVLTWRGAFIFSAIILVFIIVQSIMDCLRGRPANYLFFSGAIIFISAALIFWPFAQNTTYRASIILDLIIVIAAFLVSWIVVRWRLRPFLYPTMLAVLGVAVLVGAYLVFPAPLEGIKSSLLGFGSIFFSALDQTVSENRSILFPSGQFTLYVLWVNYTTGFYLSLIGMGILTFQAIRSSRPGFTFLLVWSSTQLLLTLIMHRFALFYTVNVALLSAYSCLKFLEYLGSIKRASANPALPSITQQKSGRAKKLPSPSKVRVPLMSIVLGVLTVLLIVFLPNITTAIFISGLTPFAPSNAWCESLDWLKKNTPEPYGNPDFYYEDYTRAASDKYLYPDSAYAVTAWWDYGYWIVRIGHRLPSSDPAGGSGQKVAKFFTCQDLESAYTQARDMRSKYVMLNNLTVTRMYDSILLHAGMDRTQFFDGYYRPIAGTSKLEPVVLYHPEYYRSLAVRLYNFDGAAVTPKSCQVISYEERMSVEGKYKHLTSSQIFQSYEEALAFISAQPSGNYRIAGDNAFQCPVPLARVSGYRLAYSSDTKCQSADGTQMPEVKVFEYIK
jgi:dolichyl-diphosphooligosaccharide--protein glycosyltransferase